MAPWAPTLSRYGRVAGWPDDAGRGNIVLATVVKYRFEPCVNAGGPMMFWGGANLRVFGGGGGGPKHRTGGELAEHRANPLLPLNL